jgi:CubicO group peptidase (beta-lactamase class C family)
LKLVILLVALGLLGNVCLHAEPTLHWQSASQERATEATRDYAKTVKPTAVMLVHDDHVIASFGDITRKVNVRSVRKSFLSALYGIAVTEGKFSLNDTLAQLGIDDEPPRLTDAERQATARDLLMSRSGIYHPAAYETARIREQRPARGSHAPGSFWFYNNWDFNALGTIYRKMTGEDIFSSFERHIARPIGMEDYSARDGQYVFEHQSIHPAYPFSVSARDAARFGLLFAKGGRWRERQIIPAAWLAESTRSYTDRPRIGRGYGYM